jgi:hypothetical protein
MNFLCWTITNRLKKDKNIKFFQGLKNIFFLVKRNWKRLSREEDGPTTEQ